MANKITDNNNISTIYTDGSDISSSLLDNNNQNGWCIIDTPQDSLYNVRSHCGVAFFEIEGNYYLPKLNTLKNLEIFSNIVASVFIIQKYDKASMTALISKIKKISKLFSSESEVLKIIDRKNKVEKIS